MSTTIALRDVLAAHFKQHEGEWVDGRVLMQLAGAYAWRTRVSDCRRQLGMTIDNRILRNGKFKTSEYRYAGTGKLF